MTEEEAKTKWCPFSGTLPSWNDFDGARVIGARCIGSECMAWVDRPTITHVDPTKGAILDRSIKSGFCGLKPNAS